MDVVIVGGVAAGMSCAAKLKRNLKDKVNITVYEKGEAVSYGACGIPFYVSDKIKNPEDLVAKKAEDFFANGINVEIFHEVINIDTKNQVIEVKDLKNNNIFHKEYDYLVIGSGASTKKFAPLDEDLDNLLSIRNVDDGTLVKRLLNKKSVKNVIVVGAGFIGIEMAEACKKYGVNVNIIELADNVLNVMDEEISDIIEKELKNQDINIYTSSKIVKINKENNKVQSVIIETSNEEKEIKCELIINCAGISPNTNWIGSIEKDYNGAIIVNEKMQTNIENIYAAGDCSVMRSSITNKLQYAPLGTNANKQGRIIADVLSGIDPKPFKLIGSSAIKIFDLDVAKVGLSEKDAMKNNISYKTNTITGNSYASYYGTEKLLIKLVYNDKTRKILGAQCVGDGIVVPRANYFAIAIYSGLTVDEMGFMDLCYSPPFSGVWDAALIAANTAK